MWIMEYFSYLALVEYRTKWIRIKWGPGVVLSHVLSNQLFSVILVAYNLSKFSVLCYSATSCQCDIVIVLAWEKLLTTPLSKRIVVAENFWHSALKQQKKLEPRRWCAIPLGQCTLGWIAIKFRKFKQKWQKESKNNQKMPKYTKKLPKNLTFLIFFLYLPKSFGGAWIVSKKISNPLWHFV